MSHTPQVQDTYTLHSRMPLDKPHLTKDKPDKVVGDRTRYNPDKWIEAKALVLAGHTYKQAASKVGISQRTLEQKAFKEKWFQQREQLIKAQEQKVVAAAEVAIHEVLARRRGPWQDRASQAVERITSLILDSPKPEDSKDLAQQGRALESVVRAGRAIYGLEDSGSVRVNIGLVGTWEPRNVSNNVTIDVPALPEST
jgi:hypothetical protein